MRRPGQSLATKRSVSTHQWFARHNSQQADIGGKILSMMDNRPSIRPPSRLPFSCVAGTEARYALIAGSTLPRPSLVYCFREAFVRVTDPLPPGYAGP
jgi:hypothetical protein